MDVDALKHHCRSLANARESDHGEPWNFLVYTIGERKFAYFKTSEPERWRFSTWVSPERFVELTDVPGVKPARWRGRYHWITIVRVETFPEDYLVEIVEASYLHALDSLGKRKRATLVSPSRRHRTGAHAAGSSLQHR